MAQHKTKLGEARDMYDEKNRRDMKALERRYEDLIDAQRLESRKKRMQLGKELTRAPPTVAPTAPAPPTRMAAPVAHAQAHMHMSMHPQQGYAPPPTMQYGYNRTTNMDIQRMMAAYRPF